MYGYSPSPSSHELTLSSKASGDIEWNNCPSPGSCTPPEQLGELLSGDSDGDWSARVHHELYHREE